VNIDYDSDKACMDASYKSLEATVTELESENKRLLAKVERLGRCHEKALEALKKIQKLNPIASYVYECNDIADQALQEIGATTYKVGGGNMAGND
jgi:hypothetical protein